MLRMSSHLPLKLPTRLLAQQCRARFAAQSLQLQQQRHFANRDGVWSNEVQDDDYSKNVEAKSIFTEAERSALQAISEAEKTDPPKPFELSEISQAVRSAMRKIPHPLMIVHAEPPDAPCVGLLVSSFNTVTLHPEPFVSFNIKLPSTTHRAIAASAGMFTVSALWHPGPARRFGGYYTPETGGPRGGPLVGDDVFRSYLAKHSLWGMRCQWIEEKSVEVGDHLVVIGKVLDMLPPGDEADMKHALIYVNGEYRKAGAKMMNFLQLVKGREWKMKELEDTIRKKIAAEGEM